MVKGSNNYNKQKKAVALAYKLKDRGGKLIMIDKWYPSSKTCRHCGYIKHDLRLSDRVWVVPS